MDEILQVLKALLPGKSEKVYKSIVAMLQLEDKELNANDGPTIKSIASDLQGLGYKVQLPGMETATAVTQKSASPFPHNPNPVTPMNNEPDDAPAELTPSQKGSAAFHQSRMGDRTAAMKSILSDIIGGDYQQTMYDQNVAFAKFLRVGENKLNLAEQKLLTRQFFPEDAVMKAILDEGMDVATIKATQVEAQGELGGIAVPPNRQSEITTRLPGLTAVRGNGANVITLTNSNSVEIPQWRGDSNRYIGMIRGQWGTETQVPGEQNFKLDMVPVVANVYTYKVPMSQSLVEDASNLVTMLMNDIAITLAMDEDEAFLIGDGIGKPQGILPGGLNLNGLREVVTGDADELTPVGVKALKRGLASQYRRNGVWIATSNTYGLIETMKLGVDSPAFAFPDLSEEDKLLNRSIFESEAWPEVAANAFPLLFGWMMGYDIVERLGMTIQRFQDSNTGPNKVEYHVRKRIGGKLERPWMFALQKVATGDPFSG